jgi:hypothetical protein
LFIIGNVKRRRLGIIIRRRSKRWWRRRRRRKRRRGSGRETCRCWLDLTYLCADMSRYEMAG